MTTTGPIAVLIATFLAAGVEAIEMCIEAKHRSAARAHRLEQSVRE